MLIVEFVGNKLKFSFLFVNIIDLIESLKYNHIMRILGIDPGYGIVGYGVIDYVNGQCNVIDYGVI